MQPLTLTRMMMSTWATQVIITGKLAEAVWQQPQSRPADVSATV